MSAQIEHGWLFQDQPTAEIETQRAHLIDILEALTTRDNARQVLSNRIDAKLAHASLLTRAAFASDPKTMSWAATQSSRYLHACNGITLSPPANDSAELTSTQDGRMHAETVNQSAVRVTQ